MCAEGEEEKAPAASANEIHAEGAARPSLPKPLPIPPAMAPTMP